MNCEMSLTTGVESATDYTDLTDFNPDCLEGAVPFAKKTALAILLVCGEGLFIRIQTQNVCWADFHANIAAGACGSVDVNLRHGPLLLCERRDANVVSDEPERDGKTPAVLHPITSDLYRAIE
jgi:hypothetical protein